MIVNQWGRIADWDWNTAHVHDSVFHPMIRRFQQRMVIETVFSMLTRIARFKQQTHRAWAYCTAHLSLAMAAFNLLVQWHGVQPDENGCIPLSIAEFGL